METDAVTGTSTAWAAPAPGSGVEGRRVARPEPSDEFAVRPEGLTVVVAPQGATRRRLAERLGDGELEPLVLPFASPVLGRAALVGRRARSQERRALAHCEAARAAEEAAAARHDLDRARAELEEATAARAAAVERHRAASSARAAAEEAAASLRREHDRLLEQAEEARREVALRRRAHEDLAATEELFRREAAEPFVSDRRLAEEGRATVLAARAALAARLLPIDLGPSAVAFSEALVAAERGRPLPDARSVALADRGAALRERRAALDAAEAELRRALAEAEDRLAACRNLVRRLPQVAGDRAVHHQGVLTAADTMATELMALAAAAHPEAVVLEVEEAEHAASVVAHLGFDPGDRADEVLRAPVLVPRVPVELAAALTEAVAAAGRRVEQVSWARLALEDELAELGRSLVARESAAVTARRAEDHAAVALARCDVAADTAAAAVAAIEQRHRLAEVLAAEAGDRARRLLAAAEADEEAGARVDEEAAAVAEGADVAALAFRFGADPEQRARMEAELRSRAARLDPGRPLVLDEPFDAPAPADVVALLDALPGLGVPVVVFTEDPVVEAWARRAAADRVLLVHLPDGDGPVSVDASPPRWGAGPAAG